MICLLIVAIILIIILGFFLRKMKQDTSCINIENYIFLKESPYANQLSKYKIIKEENQIKFTTKGGYTLFFIRPESKNSNMEVTLIGIDGYGLRNKEFKRYVCKLIDKI